MSNMPTSFNAPAACEHWWEPVSMVFETQLLDEHGRVVVRQPDLQRARTYFICRKCASHTYMTTQWVGFRLHGSEDALADVASPSDGVNRPAWRLEGNDDA